MTPTSPTLPTRITTERLAFRPWAHSDAEALQTLHQASAAGLHRWYGGTLAKQALEDGDAGRYIAGAIAGFQDLSWIEYAAFERANGSLVGAVSLHHLDWTVPKGRVGYFVDARRSGHGYATEMAAAITRLAFSTLGLQRLEIRVATGNTASNSVPRKLGYHHLTVFEKNKRGADGTLWDLDIHVRFDDVHLPGLYNHAD